jgi:hypothetical protein
MVQDILAWAAGVIAAVAASPAVSFVLSKIGGIMDIARTRYNVNPVIFLILYVVPGPFWYYTIFRTIRAIARKDSSQAMLWGMICLVLTVEPYVYVLIFGRNMPWWIYIIIGVLVAQGIFTLVRRLVKKPAGKEGEKPAGPDASAGQDAAAKQPSADL